jgi:predicted RNase H-like nuclease (RuvC/YqgF family)
MLIDRIRNLVHKSCKTRKLIKDLETKTNAVEAEASLIMEKKDKRIIELEAIIKEYEEKLSNKNKHITELEEKLGGGAENMPLVDNVSLVHLLMI